MFSSFKQVILSQEMKGHSNPVMALTEHLDYDWVKFIIVIIIITTIITSSSLIVIITVSARLLCVLTIGMLGFQGWYVQGVECEHS